MNERNLFLSLVRGQLISISGIKKNFTKIVWVFFLFLLVILFHIGVDASLIKVEQNKRTIKDLEIEHTQKVFELARLGRRSTVIEILEAEGSQIGEPEKPAGRLK